MDKEQILKRLEEIQNEMKDESKVKAMKSEDFDAVEKEIENLKADLSDIEARERIQKGLENIEAGKEVANVVENILG